MRHLAKSVWILPGWKKRLPFSSYRTLQIFLRTNLTRVPLARKDHLVRWSFFSMCALLIHQHPFSGPISYGAGLGIGCADSGRN